MPKSRTGVRKKNYKRKYRKNKNKGYRLNRAQALRVLNEVTHGFMGIEKKFWDTWETNQPITVSTTDSSGGFLVDPEVRLCLNSPSQGDGPSQRDGRQIVMDSLYITGQVIVNSDPAITAPLVNPMVTIFIILDTQTNGAQLNPADVFTNPSGTAVLCGNPLRNLASVQRFKILRTIRLTASDFLGLQLTNPVVTTDPTPVFAQAGAAARFDEYINLKGMKVNFIPTGTESTISTIQDNSIHIMAYRGDSAETDADAAPVEISYNARLRFRG
jgi:hypothetical protein